MKPCKDYRIEMTIRNGNFGVVDEVSFSGHSAIVDAIYYLDIKYKPAPIEIIKKFW